MLYIFYYDLIINEESTLLASVNFLLTQAFYLVDKAIWEQTDKQSSLVHNWRSLLWP